MFVAQKKREGEKKNRVTTETLRSLPRSLTIRLRKGVQKLLVGDGPRNNPAGAPKAKL